MTDITEIARAVEAEGADSVSLINTMLGMAIDAEKRKPVLSTITGGLSGPCVKPVALRMVWQTYKAVKIPIIGCGGVHAGRSYSNPDRDLQFCRSSRWYKGYRRDERLL